MQIAGDGLTWRNLFHLFHSSQSNFTPAPFIYVKDISIFQKNLIMHPPLTLHRHPLCADIIEQFQKCHLDHPVGKFFGDCTDLKIKLDRCFRQEKAVKRKVNFEESKKLKERLRAYRKEEAERSNEEKTFMQA